MKTIALTGISTQLKAGAGNDLWIVYLPKGDKTVDQRGSDGTATKLRVNPSALSAKRMEAARRLIASKGGNQPYTDYNHDDKEASGRPLKFAWNDAFGVIGLTRRTPAALEATTGDPPEFQAFSPHVPIDEETGEAAGLYMNCGGFVNRPLFGDQTSLSAAAHLSSELVAADPNAVELVSAAQDDEATNAAETQEKTHVEKFKALIASLCAAFNIVTDGKTEEVIATELTAAFKTHQEKVVALEGRGALVEPVIVALGFEKTATPKVEDLTGKITLLGKPGDEVIGKELVGMAVSIGLVAPAEREEWERRLAKDRTGWTKELIAKAPTVLLGRVVPTQAANADTAGKSDWKAKAVEMIAKDPALQLIQKERGPEAAISRAIEIINQRAENVVRAPTVATA